MTDNREIQGSALIAHLNDLLQLDHDAVEAYTIAIDLARDEHIRDQLVEFRADHKRHIEEIAAEVRARGALPIELPHPTGPLKLAVQTIGAAAGDLALLLAFKAVEGQVRDKYRGYSRNQYPSGAGDVVTRAAADEERHYEWVERELRKRGAGEGTIPHGIAGLVEGVHKILANPVERVEREIMERVGNVVGTTRTRGGSEAPSPRDVANGMAANSPRPGMDDDDPTRPSDAQPSRIIYEPRDGML